MNGENGRVGALRRPDAAARRPYHPLHSYLYSSRKTTRRCFVHAQMSESNG